MSREPAPSLTEISFRRMGARRCNCCGRDHWNDSGMCDPCQADQHGTSSPKSSPATKTIRMPMRSDQEWD